MYVKSENCDLLKKCLTNVHYFHPVTVYVNMSLYMYIMYVFLLCIREFCVPECLNVESRGRHRVYFIPRHLIAWNQGLLLAKFGLA